MGVSKLLVLLGVLLILGGCYKRPSPPRDNPVNHTEIRYDTKHTLQYIPNTGEFRTTFIGSRCWLPTAPGSIYQDHVFVFDDASDTLTLIINDQYGLAPGDSYGYLLSQIDSQTSSTLQTWQITTAVPDDAKKREHFFTFDIRLQGAAPLTWDSRKIIAGIYQLSQTSRSLGVDLNFQVGNPVQATEICSAKD